LVHGEDAVRLNATVPADAVVALDVLQLLAEPTGMLAEVTRLLRPQGRLALTTWEGFGDAPARFPRNLPAFIERAGLCVDRCIERPAWLQRQLRIYQHAAELAVEAPGDLAICDPRRRGAPLSNTSSSSPYRSNTARLAPKSPLTNSRASDLEVNTGVPWATD
jgi:hypothetical protein